VPKREQAKMKDKNEAEEFPSDGNQFNSRAAPN
jgi:hypothetical protein